LKLSPEELETRVSVLERKVIREKKARNLAEIQLEKYSLDIYQANQSLKIALASSTQKQLELEYLANTSSNIASDATLNEMIAEMVNLTGAFCSSRHGLFIISEQGDKVIEQTNEVWGKEQGWYKHDELKNFIINLLPFQQEKILDSWNSLHIENESTFCNGTFNLISYTNFALTGNQIGWIIFLNNSEKCNKCNKDRHSALMTSRDNLLAGIHRRLTDIKMSKRNVQLQDSLSKLKKTRHQLIQSEKMASLGQLAAGVAHEINNPIAFIRSNMEVLKDYLIDYRLLSTEITETIEKDNNLNASTFNNIREKFDLNYIEEDSDDLLKSNIEGLDRVKEIVDNLKGFSHTGNEVLVEMSLYLCVSSALQVVGNIFKYKHTIENNVPEDCPLILGNAGQLQQVFVNLFVNAAYAMKDGGFLTINYSQNKENLIIHVQDTGSGMDNKTVNQLFTPFFTTKPVGSGTGLGLSISYSILEAHGAEISVESKVNIGTTFSLKFPTIT
jgi:signal transduction histidine kinase